MAKEKRKSYENCPCNIVLLQNMQHPMISRCVKFGYLDLNGKRSITRNILVPNHAFSGLNYAHNKFFENI